MEWFRALALRRPDRLVMGLSLLLVASCGVEEGQDVVRSTEQAEFVKVCPPGILHFTHFPVAGTAHRDWFINNYSDLDHSRGKQKLDWMGYTGGLARTYNGHNGIDIDIPNFRDMDSNKALIRAVTAGEVEKVIDSAFDRNLSPSGGWNVVEIRHANGSLIRYGHIKKDSALVSKGDHVSAGQPLAVVGSSGKSDHPHLHLDVHDCNGNQILFLNNKWAPSVRPDYHPESGVMDVVINKNNTLNQAKIQDPSPNVALFKPGDTLNIGLVVATHQGDAFKLELQPPSGPVDTWTWNVGGNMRLRKGFEQWDKTISDKPGTWVLRVYANGKLNTSNTFKVSNYAPGLPEVTVHGVAASKYQGVFTDVTTAGYQLYWVDGYKDGVSARFNAIFRPSGGYAWTARHGMSAAAMTQERQLRVNEQGYRMHQLESYMHGGLVRYAAIFTKQRGLPQASYIGADEALHNYLASTYRKLGYRAVNVAVVSVWGKRRFTALYDKGSTGGGWVAERDVTIGQFQSYFNAREAQGWHLRYLNAYPHNNTIYVSAIWYRQPIRWNRYTHHDQSYGGYKTLAASYAASGYLTWFVTGYKRYSWLERFAGHWAK